MPAVLIVQDWEMRHTFLCDIRWPYVNDLQKVKFTHSRVNTFFISYYHHLTKLHGWKKECRSSGKLCWLLYTAEVTIKRILLCQRSGDRAWAQTQRMFSTLPMHLGKEKTCFNTILLYTYCVGVWQELPDRAHLRTARLLRRSYTTLWPGRRFLLNAFFCLLSWFGWVSFGVCTMESMAKHCFKHCLQKTKLESSLWQVCQKWCHLSFCVSEEFQGTLRGFRLPAFSALTKHPRSIAYCKLPSIRTRAHFGFTGPSQKSKLRLIPQFKKLG